MKMIEAIIQPEQLDSVKQELYKENVGKMTVFQVKGCGQQMGYSESYRGVTHQINLLPKVCIRIGVNDDFVDKTVKAIIKGAKTGNIGDGKIFVLPLEQCYRIRTDEEGDAAIG